MTSTGTRTLTICFGLPRTLLSINARRRMHWAKEATLVKNQRADAAWAALTQTPFTVRPVFPTGRVRVDLTIHPRKGQRRPDDLALWEACKPWLDGLADAGIVADDRQCVAGALVWSDERTGKIVLTLTEVAATGEDGHD